MAAALLGLTAVTTARVPPLGRVPAPALVAMSTPTAAGAHSDEDAFSEWLLEKLAAAPGAEEYAALFSDMHASVLRWRRRYRGNARLWKSIMKADRVVKELVEAAPVLAAAREVVAAGAPGERFTIVDLCSGKGFVSMVLSELLPADRVDACAPPAPPPRASPRPRTPPARPLAPLRRCARRQGVAAL